MKVKQRMDLDKMRAMMNQQNTESTKLAKLRADTSIEKTILEPKNGSNNWLI